MSSTVVFPGLSESTRYSMGVSPESDTIQEHWLQSWYKAKEHSKPLREAELFQELAETWLNDERFTSSLTEIITHPSYLRIIGMGQSVVPLLLKELQQRPNHWFTALHAITGENPVNPAHMGDFQQMTNAWLLWGRDHRYIP